MLVFVYAKFKKIFDCISSLKDMANIYVSERTVRRRLASAGIFAFVATRKEFLTAKHKEIRFKFSNDYSKKSFDFWRNTIFSDEKSFG